MTGDTDDSVTVARRLIDDGSYMTLATADASGHPWPSPVWYAHVGYLEFFWVSSPESRHSRNLAERQQAGIVIFDFHAPIGTGQAVYLQADVDQVSGDDMSRGLGVFSAKSQAQAASPWTPADVEAPARLRLYWATVSEAFILDGRDQRIRVRIQPDTDA
jgi:pyridoxine/pyridoxamine 5'-phosphate oxidase